MKQRRIFGMIGGGLTLALILYAGVSVSGRWDGGGEEAGTPAQTTSAASLTPVTFTRVSEVVVEGRTVLQISGLAQPFAVVVLLDRGDRIRQVRASAQGVWSAQIDVSGPGMAIEAVLFEGSEAQPQGPTNVPGTLESMTQIRGVETIFRLQRPADPDPDPEPDSESSSLAERSALDSSELDIPLVRLDTGPLIMITAPGAPTRLVRTPFSDLPTNGAISLMTIDYDDSGGVIVSGQSGRPGRIRIYVGDAPIGETRVGEDGIWTYYDRLVMPFGTYDVRAEIVEDPLGATVSVPFERLPPLPASPSDDGSLSVSFSPQRWQIRRSLVGGGSQSTVIFAPAPPPLAPQGDAEEDVTSDPGSPLTPPVEP